MALEIQTRASENVFILHCKGRITFGDEGAALRERVSSLLSGTPNVVLNLAGVDQIDSGGLGILVGLFISATRRGGDLKLVAPSRRLADVLRCTKLDGVFNMYGNDEEAIAAFRQHVA